MRVFITGATGFIGRRLINKLQESDAEVIALVRSDNHGLPRGTGTIAGDLLVPTSFGDVGKGCERLYHLAGLITFDPMQRDNLLETNAAGTSNILAAARRWNVDRTVVVSSAITMGLSNDCHRFLDEDSIPSPNIARLNPYMESKLHAENAALNASEGQDVVIVNPTTVYGPGDRTLNSGRLILAISRSHFMLIPPGGGNVVDVDDLVDGILAAGERGQPGRKYILGNANLQFSQIFKTIARTIDRQPLMLPLPRISRRLASVAAWACSHLVNDRFMTPQIVDDLFAYKYYSSKRAERELGWFPRYSFEQSIQRAWHFYKENALA